MAQRSEPNDRVIRSAGMTRVVVCLLSVVLAAGCGMPAGSGSVPLASDGTAAASPSGTPHPASSTPVVSAGTGGATSTGAPPATAAAARAAFLSHVFTDVRDGKQFRLDDFRGKQVFVIGMAVW